MLYNFTIIFDIIFIIFAILNIGISSDKVGWICALLWCINTLEGDIRIRNEK